MSNQCAFCLTHVTELKARGVKTCPSPIDPKILICTECLAEARKMVDEMKEQRRYTS